MTKKSISSLLNGIDCKILLLLLICCLTINSISQKNSAYLFSYFKENGEDGLHLAYSYDGLKWECLNNESAYLSPVAGKDKLMRDPCIIQSPDGTFHMVWTVSWNEKGIGYASSRDLINWSEQKYIPVMEHEPSARNCWAPEITYDPQSRLYMIYWSSTITDRFRETESTLEKGYNHRIYYITTPDFKTYSKTNLLYDKGFNVIDATIIPYGKKFILFMKDETAQPPQKNIRISYSGKLTGPYDNPSKPITGNYWAEGPTCMNINGYWYVYFDKYRDHIYGAVRSKDLQHWEDVSELINFPDGTRHGTVIKVSKNTIEKLIYNKSPVVTRDYKEALENGRLVNEGFNRCIAYVNAWQKYADSATGLIPKNITDSKDYWNAWDAAADNYAYMVLTSSILMPRFFKETALNMLNTERILTSRISKLPDTYSFSKKGFRNDLIDTSQIIFGSAEYMKDGLIPLTEWLGNSPWSDRLLEILDDLPKLAKLVTQVKGEGFGKSAVVEVNGDLLQVLSRMYWFTGKHEYLQWASEIADYYLNDERLPTIGLNKLRIRDHGCEIISGLCEAYFAASYAMPEKRNQWRKYIHKMLDRILEVGRNQDGLFYDEVNPQSGEILSSRIADNFGYTFNAYYTVALIDSIPAYRDAVIKGLNSLNTKYRNHNWEGNADGYADAIEGALNLYNREPISSVKEWLDSEIKLLWNFQKPDGMIEGWHGDGNFARTTLMYCLWKTQGIVSSPWNANLSLGAYSKNDTLYIAVNSESNWSGRLKFDLPRHMGKMHLPIDYPRINQYQEWFIVEEQRMYTVHFIQSGRKQVFKGLDLIHGIPVSLKKGDSIFIKLELNSK